jgi:hypothetical protein
MTSETYDLRGRQQSTVAGSVILTFVSSLAAILVLAGLAYAAGTTARHQRALAAAGCEPNLSPSGLQCTTVWMLERQWTKLTTSDVQQLNADAAAYTAAARTNLAAAEMALTAQVTSAKAFAASLARFPFPPAVAPQAKTLIQAIDARVKLITEQARSSSLAQLRSFNAPIDATGVKIQTDMNLVHKALFTRPTAAQEPDGGSCGQACPGQGAVPTG